MKKEMDQSKEGVAVTRTQRRTVNDTRVKLKANAVGARIITAKTEMTPPLLVTYDEDRSPTPLSWERERERDAFFEFYRKARKVNSQPNDSSRRKNFSLPRYMRWSIEKKKEIKQLRY